MFDDPLGPINHFSWGRFIIDGTTHSEDGLGYGKDICIVGGIVSEWTERHGHNLKKKMVARIFNLPVDILVIGIGVHSALNVPEETVQELHAHGIADVELHPTHLACARFNELYHQGRRVALLAHGTC